MSKNKVRGYIVLGIIFLVFTVIAFAAPFSMKASFWIAYVFGVLAIAYQIYVFKISFLKGKDAKSRFYGFPILKVGVLYLIVQLIISFIEMGLAVIVPTWVVLIINMILLASAVIGCIAADVVREEIVRQDVKIDTDVSNMKSLRTLSTSLSVYCRDEELKTMLKTMAEEFRYSDPVSSEQTKEIENILEKQLQELKNFLMEEKAEEAKKTCKEIIGNLTERNRICMLSKK